MGVEGGLVGDGFPYENANEYEDEYDDEQYECDEDDELEDEYDESTEADDGEDVEVGWK